MEEMRQHVTFDSQTGTDPLEQFAPDSMRQTLSSLTSNTQMSGQSSGRIPSRPARHQRDRASGARYLHMVGGAFVSLVLLAAGAA